MAQTAMQHAFANAKTATPIATKKTLKEQTWLWLRDHPNMTSVEMVEVYGKIASLTLCALEERGMVLTTKVMNPTTKRGHKLYRVEPKMRGVYELWPKINPEPSRAKTKAQPQPPATHATMEAPTPAPTPKHSRVEPPVTGRTIPACLQNVPMQEALEAYRYLKTLFD